MRIGIICAMEEEAKPIIEKLNLVKFSSDLYHDEKSNIVLVICGIGKVNAQNATWRLISIGFEKIINIGTCGDMGDHPGVNMPNLYFDGDFDLSMFGNTTKDPAKVNYKWVLNNTKPANPLECYTCSTFVTDKRFEGQLVDMESYAIYAACNAVGVQFLGVKIVSDSCDAEEFSENVEEDIENNVVAQHIDEVLEIINNYDFYYSKTFNWEE